MMGRSAALCHVPIAVISIAQRGMRNAEVVQGDDLNTGLPKAPPYKVSVT